ncbi:amino acid ABC transporter permease [Microbacterium sp. SSW1-49]|uniref:Amino acid ABC transporter permease n=1 Tax=Microbacterium croceum TaxID=2851645 RepID=A0ABT0FIJ3_9MICO|nr:amino acid ABC transporter permease [Microbacterium croceum]MCK2037881.1 amino acid ABC transporter permease [Microbacterium croceum]
MFTSFDLPDLLLILQGAFVTLQICLLSVILGGVVGIVSGILAASPSAPLRWISAIWVGAIRGVPVLLIIFFVYFALPLMSPGTNVPDYWAAVLALTIFASAYISEIVRGSIQAIPRGQFEAAQALGLSWPQQLRHVVMPQAARIMVPPGIGFLVVLIKDSSLVAVIGLIELTRAGNIVASQTGQPILAYLVVGAVYFVICFALSAAGRRYERRLTIHARAPRVEDALTPSRGDSK